MSAVVIVGASIAGLSVAEGLRENGYPGPITLIGGEHHLPYRRPALSKQVLKGLWSAQRAALIDTDRLAALGVTLLTGLTAKEVNLADRFVEVDRSECKIRFDTLVIATGAQARRIPEIPQAVTVRTLDDVLALREQFAAGRRLTVIGAGVLGCELAASAREVGLEVELLAHGQSLQIGGLGRVVGDRIARLLRGRGVGIRFGVAAISGSGRATGPQTLTLSDGSILESDVVIAAVGADPAVDWLRTSGLDLRNGVMCDASGMAVPGVYAVGDVAAWWDPVSGRHVRAESQTDAIEQAQIVAKVLTGGVPEEDRHMYFWTEFFDTHVQALGRFPTDSVFRVIAGDMDSDQFVLAYGPEGATTGIVGWNMAREFRLARSQVITSGHRSLTKGIPSS